MEIPELPNDPCADKIAYESPKEARAAIATVSYWYKRPKLKVYQCKHCNLYHLTQQSDVD